MQCCVSQPDKHVAYLCVGGPYDGRRYATNDKRLGFQVPKLVRKAGMLTVFDPDIAHAILENITYVAQRIPCGDPDKDVWVWRPYEQSMQATIELLLRRYEQASNILWSGDPFT